MDLIRLFNRFLRPGAFSLPSIRFDSRENKRPGIRFDDLVIPGTNLPMDLRFRSSDRCYIFQDFYAKDGDTVAGMWGTQDTSAAGTPILAHTNIAPDGGYMMKLATTEEAEAITLYCADTLMIPIEKQPVITFGLSITSDTSGGGGLLGASDIIVVGLASARNATLDSIATNAWFRFEGANHNVLVETDDNSVNNDDNDTGEDWGETTPMRLTIDCRNLADIRFLVNDVDVTPETMTMAAATGKVQPFIEVTKASAANMDHMVLIDYVEMSWLRTY